MNKLINDVKATKGGSEFSKPMSLKERSSTGIDINPFITGSYWRGGL